MCLRIQPPGKASKTLKGLSESKSQLICLLNCLHQKLRKMSMVSVNPQRVLKHPDTQLPPSVQGEDDFVTNKGQLPCRLCHTYRILLENLMFPAQSRKNGKDQRLSILFLFCSIFLTDKNQKKAKLCGRKKNFPIFLYYPP